MARDTGSSQFPAPTWKLTTIRNSGPEDAMPSSGLSEQCMYMVHSQTDSHTHKIKINIISKRKKVICVLFPSCEPSELQDVCMMCSV